jgi:hypothetical protein
MVTVIQFFVWLDGWNVDRGWKSGWAPSKSYPFTVLLHLWSRFSPWLDQASPLLSLHWPPPRLLSRTALAAPWSPSCRRLAAHGQHLWLQRSSTPRPTAAEPLPHPAPSNRLEPPMAAPRLSPLDAFHGCLESSLNVGPRALHGRRHVVWSPSASSLCCRPVTEFVQERERRRGNSWARSGWPYPPKFVGRAQPPFWRNIPRIWLSIATLLL